MPKPMTASQPATVAATDEINLDDIQALGRFCRRYPDLADEPRMRWLIYRRQANGLERCGAIVKRAGRWYVVVPRMKNWLLQSA